MSKPSTLPRWATGGSAQIKEPTSGKKDLGFVSAEKPPNQYFDWLFNTIYLWLVYLDALNTTAAVGCVFPSPYVATNWAANASTDALESSGAGDALVDLRINEGAHLEKVQMWVEGNASANFTWTVEKHVNDGTSVTVATQVVLAPAASFSDYQIRLDAHTTSGLTVTVDVSNPADPFYTRSTGSYLADGFYVGQSVTWAGMVNSGNNGAHTITSLTATQMHFTDGGHVAEVATAGTSVAAADVGLTPDDTFRLTLRLTASATGLKARFLRRTWLNPA